MPPTNLDLDTMRSLVLAADLGGYGQAATRLGRTPSAVSLQMKRLQESLGTTLFRKHGRKVVLTEAGEIALRFGKAVRGPLEVIGIAERIKIVGGARLGPLRLGGVDRPHDEEVAAAERRGDTVGDVGLWELNEAFAVQVLYCADKLGIPHDKLNVNGGAIAVGHPYGVSGARLTATSVSVSVQARAARHGRRRTRFPAKS